MKKETKSTMPGEAFENRKQEACCEIDTHQAVVLFLRALPALAYDHSQHPSRRWLNRVHPHHDEPHEPYE